MDIHSEESNDMTLNHPDIERVENIRKKAKLNNYQVQPQTKSPLKKPTDKQQEKIEKEKIREALKQKRLEEKRLLEEEKLLRKQEKEQKKIENEKMKKEYIERRLEEKRLQEEERARQLAIKAEERIQRKVESEIIRENLKKQKLEEKRIAEEESLKKRKEQALKGMNYLLKISTKYSEFFKEKLLANSEKSSVTKPLQEKNRLLPTVHDMKEAVDADIQTPEVKAENNVMDKLKFFEGGSLREYQVEGVQWMINLLNNGINGILADEMGLGKTVQVIALIAHLMEIKVPGPFLILAPLSTIPNWEMEFKRFAPKIPVVIFHGTEAERINLYTDIRRKFKVGDFATNPVVLTTYQTPLIEHKFLNKLQWQYIIIDEGHRVKNHESQLAVILRSLSSSNRLLLTGTPIHNNITELWALLNFLMPHIFNHVDTFASLLMLEDMKDENKLIEAEEKTNFITTLHKVLEPFVLRRLKKDVLGDIVPKKELNIYCPLTKLQHDLYNYVINKNMAMLLRNKEDAPLPPRRIRKPKNYYIPKEEDDDFSDYEEELLKIENADTNQNLKKEHAPFISRLTMNAPMIMFKKIVDHPYLIHFPLDPDAEEKALLINEDLIRSSGKLMVLDQILRRLKQDGHKVLIFSTLVMSLDLIEEALIMRGYKYCRLDGGLRLHERKHNIESFNNDPDVFAFLLSTRSGGLGLNLTGADTVIFFDRDWNPQIDIQAQDRCHRIGQTKPVMVYTLVAKNTIDDLVINRGYQKRLLEKIVIQDGKFTTKSRQTTRIEDELKELQLLLKEQTTNFDDLTIADSELNRLLDRSELWAIMNQKENKM